MTDFYIECDTCGERFPINFDQGKASIARWLVETDIGDEVVTHCPTCEPIDPNA